MFWTSIVSFLLLLNGSLAAIRREKPGKCLENVGASLLGYPTRRIKIPIDHFHNESRYEPHSNESFNNRFWFDATYYKPGGPVIVENKGEDPYTDNVDLKVGLLIELARASQGLAVIFEHRYYGSVPFRVRHPKDFRFLSVEQAMADQAYFAQNVVFPGLEQYDLTAPNTPWFALGGSYPGALTAWIRIQYPEIFWGAIASSAVTALKENYWEYYDSTRIYAPPSCSEIFGKFVNVGDSILLSGDEKAAKDFKSLFKYANVNGSNAGFADYYLTIPFSTQSVTWIPCLQKFDGMRACKILTWPYLLYPEAKKFKDTVKAIFSRSNFSSEADELTNSFLNYLGWSNGYRIENGTKTSSDGSGSSGLDLDIAPRDPPPSPAYVYSEEWLAWNYQLCTELGLFITGDIPPKPGTLPVISSLVTLHFVKNMWCREQTYLNLTEIGDSFSSKLNSYGGFNVSYDRLMLTGGEVDPWRAATALATPTLNNLATRLDYPSTPDQPYFVIPKLGHINDLQGIFPNQTGSGVPPESIKTVHRLEKEAILRWLKEWHALHPGYVHDVYAR